jgi:outer membrane protein insertion porin family
MRLSPFFVAMLAASATFCLSNPVRGQTLDQPTPESTSVEPTYSNEVLPTATEQSTTEANSASLLRPIYVDKDAVPISVGTQASTESRTASAQNMIVETIALPETSRPRSLTAQNPPLESSPSPTPTPTPTPAPEPTPSDSQVQPTQPEPRVLVGEVVVSGATTELEEEIYRVIKTRPGQATTRSQLQEECYLRYRLFL